MSQSVRKVEVQIKKVDESLGLAFAVAIACTTKNAAGEYEPYYDQGSVDEETGKLYSDHVTKAEMIAAVTDFMEHARVVKTMHEGEPTGMAVVHSMPWTAEVAAAFGCEPPPIEGWYVAIKADKPTLAKLASGEYSGVSIGGRAVRQKEST